MSVVFADRYEAGKTLADILVPYSSEKPVLLALPRGGVPVGYEIAQKLHSPLDVFIVRKLGSPYNPEYGIGAVTEDGTVFLNKDAIIRLTIPENVLMEIVEKEKCEIERRIGLYREGKPHMNVQERIVILVDDGLATGVTAFAAIKALRKQKPKRIVFVAPVCAFETAEEISRKADNTLCAYTPYDMQAIGMYYKNFSQISDTEVIHLLKKAKLFRRKKRM